MQRTLLQVTQEYLDATSGFYVDSIFDTDESQQVAKIAERVYYQMVQAYPDLLFTMKQRTLESIADDTKPNYLLLPSNVQKVQESTIMYNVSKTDGEVSYKELKYLTPLEFMRKTRRDNTTNSVVVEGFDENKMVVLTKQFPSYFTSFDNKYVVFDSYHSDYDTTIQASKTLLVASEEETFLQQDNFVIPIPNPLSETYLDMFLDEALTLVYQQPVGKISQRARAGRIKLQQDNRALGQSRGKKSYGRKGRTGSYVPRGHGYGN